MIFSRCPQCQDELRLPEGVAADERVRCPLCGECYLFGEIAIHLPPMLEILREARPGMAQERAIIQVNRPDLQEHRQGIEEIETCWDDEPALAAADTNDEAVDVIDQVDGQASGDSYRATPAEPTFAAFQVANAPVEISPKRSVVPSPRSKRKKKNPLLEIIKILLGGVLAIPAAQLILLWMPGNWQLSQRDPVGAVAYMDRYTPFLVPERVRNTVASQSAASKLANSSRATADASSNGRSRKSEGDKPVSGGGFFGGFGGGGLGGGVVNEQDGATSASEIDPPIDPSTPDFRDLLSDMPQEEVEDLQKSTATKNSFVQNESPSTVDGGKSGLQKTAPETSGGAGNAPESAVSKALAEAMIANDAWESAAPAAADDHRRLYRSLAVLGESLALASDSEAAVTEKIPEFLMTISTHPAKRSIVGGAAGGWLKDAKRSSQGIAIVGTIQKATGVKSQADGFWGEFIVELATKDKRNVAVIIPSSNEIVSPGNRFLGLGTIVMDPAQNLAGYTGNSDMVLQLMVLESLPAE